MKDKRMIPRNVFAFAFAIAIAMFCRLASCMTGPPSGRMDGLSTSNFKWKENERGEGGREEKR